MALSKKYRDFIDVYMETGNASEAARRSGYNGKRPDQAGYEYLRKSEIIAEIEARAALIMPRHEVIQRLAARARSSIADVLRLPFIGPMPAGQPPQAIDDWAIDLISAQQTGAVHQIKKIKAGKWGPEIEMYDPLPAQELLGKYHKLFVDKVEHTGADGAPLFPDFEKALQKTYAPDDPPTTEE
jgi:phage terminase small subunit